MDIFRPLATKESDEGPVMHKAYDLEPEEGHKQKRKRIMNWFVLDSDCYEDVSPNSDYNSWVDAETSKQGIRFKISLHAKAPPCFSRLLFKTDDAECNSPAMPNIPCGKTTISIGAMSSCYNAILLHTYVTDPKFEIFHEYFLLKNDLPSPVISRLPEMPEWSGTAGLMYRDGVYYVAELCENMSLTTKTGIFMSAGQSIPEECACICIFSSSTNNWSYKRVSFPPSLTDWCWQTHKVLALDNKFWWVDLRRGLLSCDPHQEQLALDFTELPPEIILEDDDLANVVADRCADVSDGLLRFVEISRKNEYYYDYGDCKSKPCSDKVNIWSLRNGHWICDHSLRFAHLWMDESYISRGLPSKVPLFPAIYPCDPYAVYFSIDDSPNGDGRRFGVDLCKKKVIFCSKTCEGLLFMSEFTVCEFSGNWNRTSLGF
uniref:DUF1618 domain-containing protein n=1 Tax=Leersia perrieri TaxID=77586 RepID=A0A0D9X2M6_9ORYZ